MNLVCLYYKMAFKPKMETGWFCTSRQPASPRHSILTLPSVNLLSNSLLHQVPKSYQGKTEYTAGKALSVPLGAQ